MTTEDEPARDGGEAGAGQQQEWGLYEIKIAGALEAHWERWFEGMTLEIDENAQDGTTCTLLRGPVRDQPALHGLLAAVRDLNLTLISVRRVTADTKSALKEGQNDQ